MRVGGKELVGNCHTDFCVEINVKPPVKMLWTDSVGANATVFVEKDCWAGWPRELAGLDTDPMLRPFEKPLLGKIWVSFVDTGLFDLDGLIMQFDGGGLHLALDGE